MPALFLLEPVICSPQHLVANHSRGSWVSWQASTLLTRFVSAIGRIKSSINVAFSGNGFVWSLIRVDLGENGCFRPGSRRYRPTPTQLLCSRLHGKVAD